MLVPIDYLRRARRCIVTTDKGLKWQRSQKAKRLDHAPLRIEADYQHYLDPKEQQEGWDFEALRWARTDVAITKDFLEEVQEQMQEREMLENVEETKRIRIRTEHGGEINETVMETDKKVYIEPARAEEGAAI